MSRHRHRRTFSPSAAFPSPVEPGELIVNTANRQLAVGDADAATLGIPKNLIAVRFFDTKAQYVANDVVVQAGNIYKANGAISPGAFNGANWTQLGVVTGMAANVVTFTPVGGVIATDVQGAITEVDAEKVAKAGDTMTGHLSLPTAPSAANAVRRDYVDAALTSLPTKTYVDNADAALAAADTALQTNIDAKVAKGGDTMTGHLSLPTAPAAANAVRKDYVDAADTALSSAIALKADATAVPAIATTAEYLANVAGKMLTTDKVWGAAVGVTLTESANVATPNLSLGLDFIWAIGGAGRTLANPTNGKAGQKGVIFLQTGAGGTITTWGTAYKFPGGTKPTLTVSATGVDIISYVVGGDNLTMFCTFAADFK